MAGLTALVPLDGTELSESTFALLPLLRTLGFDKVELLSVSADADEVGLTGGAAAEAEEKGYAFLSAYLKEKAVHLESPGLDVETKVIRGRPADEVLKSAAGVDLVLIATHGRTGTARFRMGSVADKVVRGASCPTLVIGPNVRVAVGNYAASRILVPLDGSELSEEALPLAARIAGTAGATLELVRVVSTQRVLVDPSEGVYSADVLAAVEDSAKQYLSAKASALRDGAVVKSTLFTGSPAQQLSQYLEVDPPGLVVMTSHGRSGFIRASLGSVTDELLRGPSPVLVLRKETKSRLLAPA